MSAINLPDMNQNEIRAFMAKTMIAKEYQTMYENLFSSIAPSLKLRVQYHCFNDYLRINPVINKFLIKLTVRKMKA